MADDEWLNEISSIKEIIKKDREQHIPRVEKKLVYRKNTHHELMMSIQNKNFNVQKVTVQYFEKMPFTSTIDLHGLTQMQAEERLELFLQQKQLMQEKVILVITGKGKNPDNQKEYGILHQSIQHFFERSAQYVVAYSYAKKHHGGDGAFYVHIRRLR